MLVVSRTLGEDIIIGEGADEIVVRLISIKGPEKARIGVLAPRNVPVDRREVRERKNKEKQLTS